MDEYDFDLNDLLLGLDLEIESETIYLVSADGLAIIIDSVSGEIYMMETLH